MLLLIFLSLLILHVAEASEKQDFPVIYNLSPATILSGFNENVTAEFMNKMDILLYNTKIQPNPEKYHQILISTQYFLAYKTERYGTIEFQAQYSAIQNPTEDTCQIEIHVLSKNSSETLPDPLPDFIWQNLREKIQKNYCSEIEKIKNSLKFLDISNGSRKSAHFVRIRYIGRNEEENIEISRDFINSELSKLYKYANTVIHWPGAKSTLANEPKIEILENSQEVRLTTVFTTVVSTLEGNSEKLTKIEARLRDIRVWRHNLEGELMWSAKYEVLNRPDIGVEFSKAKLEKFLHKNIRGTLPIQLVSTAPKWLLPHVSIAVPRGNSLFFPISHGL